MEIVLLLLLWEIILLLFSMHITAFDYTCPSFITLVMFILSTCSLLFNYYKWNVNFSYITFLIMISGLTTIVIIEAFICNYYYKENKKKSYKGIRIVEKETPWITDFFTKFIILTSSILMMTVYIINVRSIGAILDISNMVSVIGAVKNSEYHTGTLATICLRVGYALSFLYGFVFWHNIIIANQKIKSNIYLFFSMLCGMVSSFYSGSRGMIMGLIFGFLFYLIIFSRLKRGWKEVRLEKYLKYIIPITIGFITIFFFSRNVVKNRQYSTGFLEYLTYYLGNSQALLNLSILNPDDAFPIKSNIPGLYTFQFLYNELAGLKILSLPVNSISSQFMKLGSTQHGNVYTLFGEPYHDFGFFGMIIYIVVIYYVFCYFYYKYIRYWNNKIINKTILLVFGTQYHLVLFTFYLAPTIWIKLQTLVTTLIIVSMYRFIIKYKFTI